MSTLTKGRRVERHTLPSSLEKIRKTTISNIRQFSQTKIDLDSRIKSLESEWDIERYLETNASVIAFFGLILVAFVNEYWLILSAVVLIFLFQHAIQGWCPPLPIFRKFGKRTKREIEIERHALKALRGDYNSVTEAVIAYNQAKKE